MANKDGTRESLKQLVATIRSLEHALDDLYNQAGKSMLQEAERTASQANSLTEELVRAKQILAKARGDTRCPHCQTMNAFGRSLCTCCGTQLRNRKEKA